MIGWKKIPLYLLAAIGLMQLSMLSRFYFRLPSDCFQEEIMATRSPNERFTAQLLRETCGRDSEKKSLVVEISQNESGGLIVTALRSDEILQSEDGFYRPAQIGLRWKGNDLLDIAVPRSLINREPRDQFGSVRIRYIPMTTSP